MVYYSTRNIEIKKLINKFCKKINAEKIHISNVNKFYKNNNDVFFIPIYGEEELNKEWEEFLIKYSESTHNIGKNMFFYLYGVYDLIIDKNATIVKQIYNILEFLSAQINIFPLKILTKHISVETLVYYYNHAFNWNNKSKSLLNKLVFFSKQKLMENNLNLVDFTSQIDGYSSVIDTLKINKKKEFLIKLISNIKSSNVKLNRVKSINLEEILKEVKNNNILRLQLKSNNLKNIKSLKGFKSLECLNLTANIFEAIDIDELPDNISSLNMGKNKIKIIKIKKENLKIKKLILFNNKLSNMKFLEKLPNIEYLNIGLNPIKKFPKEICKLEKLKYLNLSYLSIDFLPKNIIKLNQLKIVDITGANILNSNNVIKKLRKKGIKIIS